MSPSQPTGPPTAPEEPRHLSDSPLFWFFVFGGAGLVALVVIAPKHARRQERLERMADSRQRQLTEGQLTEGQLTAGQSTERTGTQSTTAELPQAEQAPYVEQPDRREERRPDDALSSQEESAQEESTQDGTSEEVAAQDNPAPRRGETPLSRSLVPLMLFLAAVLAIAAASVGTARYLRLAEARADARKRGQVCSVENRDGL